MADLSKTVAIIFEGDDRVSKTLNELDSKFGALNTTIGNIAAPLASAADAVLAIDGALAALAVGGLAYAYKKSVEFETAMVGLKKVAGDSEETLKAARTSAFNLSAQYGESAAKVLNSTTDFVQAGYNVQESMVLTKASMDLKIAGDVEAAQSSEMLISILKGFNAPAAEATRVIDILNEVSNKYATDVEQLGLGMSKLAPIAKTMGFSFEETAGMLTPVIEVFRSGPEAADALKTGLLKLVDNTKSVQDALASIGVAQTDANGALRSGKDILQDVSIAFQSLDQNQKLFVTQQLVGIEQSARMVQVFDNLGKVTEITGVAMNSAGSAAKEVAARMASSEVQLDRFKVGFENLGITIGDKFRESATKAIAGGNEIMSAFSGLVSSGTFDPVFDALSGFSTKLYDYLKIIAKNLPAAFEKVDFDGLLDALGDLGDAFGSWFDGIDLTTVDGLAEGLQTLVDIIAG
ncbi:phage tail tape measure protein, TP901 family, core region, partial [Syntrophus gentianae]